jgi:hypothetical protein
MDLKEVGTDISKFAAGIAGVAVGQIVMGLIPSINNPTVDKILPGAAGIVGALLVASKVKDPYVKAGAFGLGIAGTSKIVNNFTAGSSNALLQKVNKATQLPEVSLKGFRGLGAADFLAALPPSPETVAVPDFAF